MRQRPDGFLRSEYQPSTTEIGDYITELHGYLWRFVRVALPHASGSLDNYIDIALQHLEGEKQKPQP